MQTVSHRLPGTVAPVVMFEVCPRPSVPNDVSVGTAGEGCVLGVPVVDPWTYFRRLGAAIACDLACFTDAPRSVPVLTMGLVYYAHPRG